MIVKPLLSDRRIARKKRCFFPHGVPLRGLSLFFGLVLLGAGPGYMPSAHAAVLLQQAPPTGGEQSAPEAQAPEKKEEVKDENAEYRNSPAVQKLGHMLGMSTETAATTFTVLNFAVLCVLVGMFLLKALPKAFRKRTTDIQKKLVDARTATEEATARLNAVETRLGKLDAEIAAMRTQAEAAGVRDEKRIRAGIEDEKAKIVAAADAEIQAATAVARRQIGQYAAELAVEQAARKLVVTAETDRLLVKNFAERLGGGNGGGN